MQLTPQELTLLLTWAIETVEPNPPAVLTAPGLPPERTITLAEVSSILAISPPAVGSKIPMIRRVRELFGCGLKDAKDVVEGSYRP